MRAIQFIQEGGQTTIAVQNDVPKPQPNASQLLVRVVASAINPSDVLNAGGKFPHTTYPRVPGRDYSGIVVQAPPSSPVPVGAEVYGTSGKYLTFTEDGAHAEYVLVPVNGVALKPKSLSFMQAAVIGTPFTTAMLLLKRTAAKKNDSVLILGASGAVGSSVSQMARNMGCRVLGAARRDNFEVNLRDDPNLQTVKSLTDGKGANVCVDTVGSVDLMSATLDNGLAVDGRLGLISSTGTDSVLQVDVRALYRAQHSIVGCNSVECTIEYMAEFLAEMTPWFDDGSLTAPEEQSLTTVSLDELKAAYEDTLAGKTKGKKFVVTFEEVIEGQ